MYTAARGLGGRVLHLACAVRAAAARRRLSAVTRRKRTSVDVVALLLLLRRERPGAPTDPGWRSVEETLMSVLNHVDTGR